MRRLMILALVASIAAPPALAQNNVDRRVERLESEVRALQRQVFPGGNPDFFQPDIQPGQPGSLPGNPASAPLTDLTDRVNSLERQLQTLTGQIEENSYRLRQLESMIEGMQAQSRPAFDGETNDGGFDVGPTEDPDTGAPTGVRPIETPASDETAADADTPPDMPFTQSDEPPLPDDPGEASYVRGYRLWRDGEYAAARTQLQQTVEQYPGHRFESYARNLLGRAYLDDNKPANATEIFVRNYQELPNGDRAADSLFFLGVALTQLEYNERACLAFDELRDVYGDELRSTIAEQVPSARQAAGCR
ncbi:outer membrane protein assembly factor BamD [uncultured Parasphingopyxis sp.]|uniref:outer membrane protein assembly factor BamD n=1 Tax=uncultured Parasphingopyxis sp. TaxID=1547918 RepID=UPI00261E6EB2|nr:outer membrane protein assembly factor BamD [uncultured Parasphingopyxis sp.]